MKLTRAYNYLLAFSLLLVLLELSILLYRLFDEKYVPPLNQNSLKVAEGNNRFAFDLYSKLKYEEGNIFYSPHSIAVALGMTYAGAKGDTALQLKNALNINIESEDFHQSLGRLNQNLDGRQKVARYDFKNSNSLWVQKHFSLKKNYSSCIEKDYSADLRQLDFINSPGLAVKEMNFWVESKTDGNIKKVFDVPLESTTKLVLINVVSFKGVWREPFKKEDTRQAPFYLNFKDKLEVSMMSLHEDVRYLEEDTFKAIELNYLGDDLSMVLFLPNKKDGLAEFEDLFDYDLFQKTLKKMKATTVNIFLPKFTMSLSLKLKKPLKSLGVKNLFDNEKCDLSNIANISHQDNNLYVDSVLHKTFIKVDEKGTEAVAVTAVYVKNSAMLEVISFNANHPFIYLIRDRKSGAILFLGRMTNPLLNN